MTQLKHLFVHTVSISPWSGQNQYGEATYGAAVSHPARIQTMNVMSKGDNQTLAGMVKVFLSEYIQVDPRDKVVIPDDYGSRNDSGVFESPTSKLIEVQYLSDRNGPVCTVLVCGGNSNNARSSI